MYADQRLVIVEVQRLATMTVQRLLVVAEQSLIIVRRMEMYHVDNLMLNTLIRKSITSDSAERSPLAELLVYIQLQHRRFLRPKVVPGVDKC